MKNTYLNLALSRQFEFKYEGGDTWLVLDGVKYEIGIGEVTASGEWFSVVKKHFEMALHNGDSYFNLYQYYQDPPNAEVKKLISLLKKGKEAD